MLENSSQPLIWLLTASQLLKTILFTEYYCIQNTLQIDCSDDCLSVYSCEVSLSFCDASFASLQHFYFDELRVFAAFSLV